MFYLSFTYSDLGLLVPGKGNFNALVYKDIVEDCTLWQRFGEEPHTGVMIRCSQTECTNNKVL